MLQSHKEISSLKHPNLLFVVDSDAQLILFSGKEKMSFVVKYEKNLTPSHWSAYVDTQGLKRVVDAISTCGQIDFELGEMSPDKPFNFLSSNWAPTEKVQFRSYAPLVRLPLVLKTQPRRPNFNASFQYEVCWSSGQPIISMPRSAGAVKAWTLSSGDRSYSATYAGRCMEIRNNSAMMIRAVGSGHDQVPSTWNCTSEPGQCITSMALAVIGLSSRIA